MGGYVERVSLDISRGSNVILEIMDSKSILRVKVKDHNSLRLGNNLLVIVGSMRLSGNLVSAFMEKTVGR